MRHNALSLDAYALGKGEVDSSILSGSTSGNANGSAAFGDFRRERSATDNPAKSGNNPVTSANSATLVTRGDAFCSYYGRGGATSHRFANRGAAQNRFTSDEVV